MKFSIERANFIDSLNKVLKAISNRTTIPILTGVKISVSNDTLTLTGSNADISIQTKITANQENQLKVVKPGSIVLKAHFFNSIVKNLPADTMTISVNDNFQTEITSGTSHFKINGLDASNYPKLPEIDTQHSVKLSGKQFKKIIQQTVIAVSDQESRPILTGVHFMLKPGVLSAVATDSHRLSQREVALTSNKAEYDVIIPGTSLLELSKMIGSQIEMRLSSNQVLFKMGETDFYSRLLEGNYPDTSQLIPDSDNTAVEFEVPKLLATIERASLLSHASRNNVIKMTLKPKSKQVTVTGDSPDVGEVEEHIAPARISGKDLEISFNPDYMKDSLRSIGAGKVKIKFLSPLRPFTLVPSDQKQNFIQLITPVRTF